MSNAVRSPISDDAEELDKVEYAMWLLTASDDDIETEQETFPVPEGLETREDAAKFLA